MEIQKKNRDLLKSNHIYDETMEHDACGVGLVASTEGLKSRKVVEYGIEALKAVWHRGAIDADGKTGDGAGIHIEIPKDFFAEKIEITGHKHDNSDLCVGMIFLPRNDFGGQEQCRTIVESELTKNNFNIYGWRQVPVNPSVLGEKAELTRPEITQVLFTHNDKAINGKDLERIIYETRRKIEKEASINHLNNFYICSFSSKSIIYKGMFLAEALSDFYTDLKDERFISRYAIFHQRFSTNTAPSWDLAQPFRSIAHNGEINTLKGNINWMKIHEEEMFSPIFENMENLKPVIPAGNSDSASLDNVFELLNISGHSAPLAKLILIPDAWSKKSKVLSRDHQQLFNFLNSTMEPWDGPAAIAATDNEWVIVASDRNGLRPLRYTVTRDKLLFAGSETGMIDLNEKKIVSKGRLGPGEILGVRIEKGKVYSNNEIKNYLAKEYKRFNNQIIELDKTLTIENEKNEFSGTILKKLQHCFGYSLEDLELILHPMAEDAKEATGSMGDDSEYIVALETYIDQMNAAFAELTQKASRTDLELRQALATYQEREAALNQIRDSENRLTDTLLAVVEHVYEGLDLLRQDIHNGVPELPELGELPPPPEGVPAPLDSPALPPRPTRSTRPTAMARPPCIRRRGTAGSRPCSTCCSVGRPSTCRTRTSLPPSITRRSTATRRSPGSWPCTAPTRASPIGTAIHPCSLRSFWLPFRIDRSSYTQRDVHGDAGVI